MENRVVRRRPAVILFVVFSLLFWLVAGALFLEWMERYTARTKPADNYAVPIVAEAEKRDLEIYEATLAGAPRPPAAIEAKCPRLTDLDGADTARLDALAGQWEGVVLECDTNGAILKLHAPALPALATLLANKVAGMKTVADIPPADHPEFGRDLVAKLARSVREWRDPQPRMPHMVGSDPPWADYMVSLPDHPYAGFRFMFHAVLQAGKNEPVVYTVAVPWRWTEVFGGFRPNCYERDAYPQFPKSEFWTNSLGFRDEELAVPKPAGLYRIVCIGGSTTLEGPRNDLTYPKMLQQLLRAHFQTEAIEVVNCGLDGGTIRGQCSSFDKCLALGPDMVIHYNFVNDASTLMDNVLKATVMKASWRRGIMWALLESQFLAHRCRWLRSLAMPGAAEYRTEMEQYLGPSLQDLRERTRKAGARFVLSSFAAPDLHNLVPGEQEWFRRHLWFTQAVPVKLDDYLLAVKAFNGMARDICDKEGVAYVPVAENIKGGLETFTDNWHMHIAGIRRKAELMFECVAPLIARDRSDFHPSKEAPLH